MLSRIKKNDLNVVVSGKYRGKGGSVIALDHKNNKLMVKNIGTVTRHVKPKKQGERGGIIQEESFIVKDKVMPICSSCKKPCRIQIKILDSGKKSRICHRCKEAF